MPLNATIYDYNYYLSDNLGNTRYTLSTLTAGYQQDDYYPFGMDINTHLASPKNEYLYNKKELQEEFTEYDYGARFYDPVIARWTSVDPLAEISRRLSSYNYVENNPIRFIDPDGMSTGDISMFGGGTYLQGEDAKNYIRQLQGQQPPKKRKNTHHLSTPSAKPDAAAYASNFPKVPFIKKDPKQFSNAMPGPQAVLKPYPDPYDVNYNDFGNPTTSLAIGTNVINGYGAVAGVFQLKAFIWGVDAYAVAVNGETAATKFGREMHALYKIDEVDNITTFKEFTGVKGFRVDFVDFGTKTIYDLKPNNLRAISQGLEQLNNYKNAFEAQYGGTWKIVLDTYNK